jgi:hypothetical protein
LTARANGTAMPCLAAARMTELDVAKNSLGASLHDTHDKKKAGRLTRLLHTP